MEQTQTLTSINKNKSIKKSHSQKIHACLYCNKKMVKISRHYLSVHKNEGEVKNILSAITNDKQKRQLMDHLRKKGDFEHNSKLANQNNNLLVCRNSNKDSTQYVTCPGCLGNYSRYNIRHHICNCVPRQDRLHKRRQIQSEVNRFDRRIHNLASEDLKIRVFSSLRDDKIKEVLRYDEAIILFGNYQCMQYPEQHNAILIRSHLRVLGKLILAAQEINNKIRNLSDLLDISNGNLIVQGIDKVARVKEDNTYDAPSTAKSLTTLLKQVCKVLETEFMQSKDEYNEKRIKRVSKFLEMRFRVTVNKKGNTTQKIHNRRKRIKLPKTDDIANFRNYLEDKVKFYTEELKKKFTSENWSLLTQYTLVILAVFNRKRPGECQRIEVEDFSHYEILEDDDEILDTNELSDDQMCKYARVRFTGKLGKNNAILINRDFGFEAIKLILAYRGQAGVPKENKFLFGKPSNKSPQETFETCSLIRKFSEESGIKNHNLLRTRLLRQHIATAAATSNVDERLENRLSDFMSHQRQIHKDYYVVTQKRDDFAKVSKLLENFSSTNIEKLPPSNIKFNEQKKSCSKNKRSDLYTEKVWDKENISGKTISTRKRKIIFGNSDPDSPAQKRILSSCNNDECNTSSSESANESSKKLKNFDILFGKKQTRTSWSSTEKKITEEHFYDKIFNNKDLEFFKIKKFYKENQHIFKTRSPHLIRQWIQWRHHKFCKEEAGHKAQRLRWSTPEKEILHSSVEEHSSDNSYPSLNECHLLKNYHPVLLRDRTPQAVKSYICRMIDEELES